MQMIIISGKKKKKERNKNKKMAIVAYLYYESTINYYVEKLLELTDYIQVIIVSSNPIVIGLLENNYKGKFCFILKENRGRDVSALLVTIKKVINEYDYFCFLHDKMSKHNFLANDINFWIEGMWDNMILSKDYIDSVIECFERGFGLLLPPRPIGEYMDALYANSWGDNYNNVCELAKCLGVEKKISKDELDKVSIGTVFWCRTKALKKLFDYNWKYEDFPEEPVPDDGTISHAVERILVFVSLDAGYKVGTIMNEKYAAKLVDVLCEKLTNTYAWMWKKLGIKNTYQLANFDSEKAEVDRLFLEKDKIYLYGAGYYGKKYLQRLALWGYSPDGFIVTDGMVKEREISGLPVYELSEIKRDEKNGIVVSANPDLQAEICEILNNKGYKDYIKATVL